MFGLWERNDDMSDLFESTTSKKNNIQVIGFKSKTWSPRTTSTSVSTPQTPSVCDSTLVNSIDLHQVGVECGVSFVCLETEQLLLSNAQKQAHGVNTTYGYANEI